MDPTNQDPTILIVSSYAFWMLKMDKFHSESGEIGKTGLNSGLIQK